METMKIHKLYPNVIEVKKGSSEAACFDIHAHMRGPVQSEDVPPTIRSINWFDSYNQPHETIPEVTFMSDDPVTTFELGPKCRALIPTGMVLDIPSGFSGRIHPRSGNAWKHGVTLINAEGVIDSIDAGMDMIWESQCIFVGDHPGWNGHELRDGM